MRRLTAAFLGIILGGGLVYGLFQFHLVRADEGWLIVPKPQASMNEPFADVRQWDAAEWADHPQLIEALIAHGRGDLVKRSVSNGLIRGLFPKFDGASQDDTDTRRR